MGPFATLGVAGVPEDVGTLPINHDGTQPRSPDSSLTAWNVTLLAAMRPTSLERYSRMTSGCNA